MHKTKRKRFLQEQKKKRKKKQLRSDQRAVMAVSVVAEPLKFKRADKFVGCNEAIELYFAPAEGDYYRVIHNPPEWNDQLVQSEQQFEGLAPSSPDVKDTIAPGSSIEDQFEQIADWSLSFNINEFFLADNYWDGHRIRRTENAKNNYIKRKGDVIALYHFTPKAGLMQREPDKDGHVVLMEYEGFVLEDFRDKEFGLRPLINYRHEQEW